MSASARFETRSRRSAPVKGFGRRLAFESLRRTNPRAAGAQYGVLGRELGLIGRPQEGNRPRMAPIKLFCRAVDAIGWRQVRAEALARKPFP